MGTIGYHPLKDIIDLSLKYEKISTAKVEDFRVKMEILGNQLDDITTLQQIILKEKEKKTKDKVKRVDLNSNPEHIALVDRVRENSKHRADSGTSAPSGSNSAIIDDHQYIWEGDDAIMSLSSRLNEESKRLGNHLAPLSMLMTHEFELYNRILEAAAKMRERVDKEIASYIKHQSVTG